MNLRRVLLDTNLYMGWLNRGLYPELMVGPGLVRYLAAVVAMELRIGARTLPARRALDKLLRASNRGPQRDAVRRSGPRSAQAARTRARDPSRFPGQ